MGELREAIRASLKRYIAESGYSQKEIAEKLGVSKSSVTNWVTGKNSPDVELVIPICKLLNITVREFFGETDCVKEPTFTEIKKEAAPGLPDEALMVARDYHGLDKWGKRVVRSVISDEQARINEEQANTAALDTPDKVIYIKRNDLKASAGDGFLLDEESTEDFAVLYNDLTRKADFCVEVQGDSMEPKLHDGDWILVRQQPSVDVGQIGLFIVDGNGYVKKQGEDRLISVNPDYDDIFPTEFSDVRCAGLVLGVLDPDWIVEE